MIYTIGGKESYERALATGNTVYKVRGGSVWKTRDEASSFRTVHPNGPLYEVFPVDADWEEDTEAIPLCDKQFSNGHPPAIDWIVSGARQLKGPRPLVRLS